MTCFITHVIFFLISLVNVFVQVMGDVFPELKENEKKIQDIIRDEEESFENTLAKVIFSQKDLLNYSICLVKFSKLFFSQLLYVFEKKNDLCVLYVCIKAKNKSLQLKSKKDIWFFISLQLPTSILFYPPFLVLVNICDVGLFTGV
jgi:hypothetical protein